MTIDTGTSFLVGSVLAVHRTVAVLTLLHALLARLVTEAFEPPSTTQRGSGRYCFSRSRGLSGSGLGSSDDN